MEKNKHLIIVKKLKYKHHSMQSIFVVLGIITDGVMSEALFLLGDRKNICAG